MKVLRNEKGQALTEYMTLLILISLVAVGSAQKIGKTINTKLQTAKSHIESDITFDGVNKSLSKKR